MIRRIPLDIYDDMPTSMKRYISNYGWHFNKKAYEYAVREMTTRNPKTNKEESVVGYTKDEVDKLLKDHNIDLTNKTMYDYVYVATMCKSDYLGKSIIDTSHLAMFVKDTLDDPDSNDEIPFRRWVATMVGIGNPIDWMEIL